MSALNDLAEHEDGHQLPGGDELVLALLKNVLWLLTYQPQNPSALDHSEQLWRWINDYIAQHFTESDLRERTAREFMIHPDHLSRLFRQHGKTFVSHVTQLRLELSRHLLLNRKLSIYEVSQQSAFSSQVYFYPASSTTIKSRRKMQGVIQMIIHDALTSADYAV